MTTMTATVTLTSAQKTAIDTLLTEKVDESEHANWRHHLTQSWPDYHRGYNALRNLPHKPEYARPKEEGLYRNPLTNKLYRLKRQQWDLIVSVYSNAAALRLTLDNEVVKKGTWKRMNAFESRMFLDRMRATWKMSQDDMVQYRTGMCNFCYRGLEDARSVHHNYGPVCAKKYGLPWGDLPTTV